MNRKPERNETNAARQARLRERRKAHGWRRVSVWLSPELVDRLETLGGEPWLGTTVRAWLESAVSARARPPVQQAALFAVPGPASPVPDTDKAALWAEADSLHSAGLSWGEIARRWNAQGRRTEKGAEYRGANIARGVRKWKGGNGE
jgi:hypothetical protein